MTQKKKRLTDSQCALRKQVALEVGMSKEEIRSEVLAAVQAIVKHRTDWIDIQGMVTKAVADATGTPAELREKVNKAVEAKMRSIVAKEVEKHLSLPKNIRVTIPISAKVEP